MDLAQRAMADLFAIACVDDSSCDESPPSAVVPSAEVCVPVTPPAAAAASKPSIAPQRSKSTLSSAGVVQRKPRAPAAKARLQRVSVDEIPSAWTTVFLQRRAGTGACQKRPRGAGDLVPVTLWPQYVHGSDVDWHVHRGFPGKSVAFKNAVLVAKFQR